MSCESSRKLIETINNLELVNIPHLNAKKSVEESNDAEILKAVGRLHKAKRVGLKTQKPSRLPSPTQSQNSPRSPTKLLKEVPKLNLPLTNRDRITRPLTSTRSHRRNITLSQEALPKPQVSAELAASVVREYLLPMLGGSSQPSRTQEPATIRDQLSLAAFIGDKNEELKAENLLKTEQIQALNH